MNTDERLVDAVLMLERLQACSLDELNDIEGDLWPDLDRLVERAKRKLDPPLSGGQKIVAPVHTASARLDGVTLPTFRRFKCDCRGVPTTMA